MYSYKEILKYRGIWMALSILWIIGYHAQLNIPGLNLILFFGYGGTDIFFFASGIGCYYSLTKNDDSLFFFRKRLMRILPAYYLVLPVWLLCKAVLNEMTLVEALGNIICIGWFARMENQFNWYINTVWMTYLFAPLLVRYVDSTSPVKRRSVLLLLIVSSVVFWNTELLIAVARVPIFYAGILFAKRSRENEFLSLRELVRYGGALILGIGILCVATLILPYESLWNYGLWWYPFILITPGLCILISVIIQKLSKICNWLVEKLMSLGQYTLELYVAHISVFSISYRLIESGTVSNSNLLWIILIAVSWAIAKILILVENNVQKRIL